MRRSLLLVGLVLVSLQPACESCEFTYGAIMVRGTVTIDGPMPDDLHIRFCTSARAETCDDAYWAQPGPLPSAVAGTPPVTYSFEGGIPSEGTLSCDFDKHWLVITGTGCVETAIDVPTSDGEQTIDAALHCG